VSPWPRIAIDRARQQDVEPVNAHPGQTIFMNDDPQASNMAIIGIAVPAAKLHLWRRVAWRSVG